MLAAKITAERACRTAERSISALRRSLLISTYWNITYGKTVRARACAKRKGEAEGAPDQTERASEVVREGENINDERLTRTRAVLASRRARRETNTLRTSWLADE